MTILTLLTIFGTSFLIAFSGALMPGPLLTVTITESSRRGFMAGPLLIAGHGILEILLVIGLVLGLGPLLQQKYVFIIIALAGSVVLLWMSICMFRSLPTLTLETEASSDKSKNLLITGILFSIVNPYWTIWWVTIGLGYILHSLNYGIWGVAAFFIGHILADLIWYTVVSVGVWRGKTFLNDRAYRIVIGACAVFLVIFAGLFMYSGIQKLIT
ncbi:LysE family transporter [Desulfococcaceae bacterium HSG9]|nr:LysE family transporter [Desulfococcaceae bacterium HSG9]